MSQEINHKRILVFDDDPTYCKLISRSSRNLNIDVTTCTTMDDFCLKALDGEFDVALVDYNLESFKGSQVAQVIDSKPTFLISNDQSLAQQTSRWGEGVLGFFSKKNPPAQILMSAAAASDT